MLLQLAGRAGTMVLGTSVLMSQLDLAPKLDSGMLNAGTLWQA